MIIQKIAAQNFQCYYQYNEFLFDKGLNVVLGSNSHGKSKLFDAIYWLLNEGDYDQHYNQESLISAKAKKNLDDFPVSVFLEIEKDGEIFNFERIFDVSIEGETVRYSKPRFEAFTLNSHGERIPQGIELLDFVFPSAIRRYCFFKGERSLNIFDPNKNPDALNNLLNNLSSFKSLDIFIGIAEKLLESTRKTIESTSRRNAKDKKNRDEKILRRNNLETEIKTLERTLSEIRSNHGKATSMRDEIIGQLEVGEHIININNRIRDLEKEIARIEGLIETYSNYTVKLFDEFWILKPYKKIQEAFEKKYKAFEKERRRLSEDYAKNLGKKELLSHLTDTPLPIGVPAKEHLEDMLEEEMCKVCNREAKKGSEAYEYMQKRLESFLKTLEPQLEQDSENPFKNEFIDELNDINRTLTKKLPFIGSIQNDIKDNLAFVTARRKDREELNDKLRKEKIDKEKLLSETSQGEKTLIDMTQNIKSLEVDIGRFERSKLEYEKELSEKKSEYDSINKELKSLNVKELPTYLIEKEEIAEDIFEIVSTTRKRKLDEIIDQIQTKANEYFSKLGEASGGYTGKIELRKDQYDNIKIFSVDENGNINSVSSLSSSTNTSLYLSIVLAISSLSKEKYSDSFPVVFDAPTSEFDESRAYEFLKQSKANFDQCIIMIKNFINDDHSLSSKINDLGPSVAYRIKLDDDINPKAIETVETKSERII